LSGAITVEIELRLLGIPRYVLWELIKHGYVNARYAPILELPETPEGEVPSFMEPISLTKTGTALLRGLVRRSGFIYGASGEYTVF
jgi:hypothetical protein